MCVTIHEIAKGLDGYEESLSRVKSLAEQNAKKTENV